MPRPVGARLVGGLGLLLLAGCNAPAAATAQPAGPAPAPAASPAPIVPPSASSAAGGWRTFRGDMRRTGRAAVDGPRTAHLRWVFRTAGRVYADVAVAADGTVYVASHDGHLYAVGPDGRERWSFDAKDEIWSSPALAPDGSILFGGDADTFFALGPDGRPRWSFSTTLPPPPGEKPAADRHDVDTSPAVGRDGTIYFASANNLFALRPQGSPRWQFVAGLPRVKVFASPALGDDGTVYFGTQGRRFFALTAQRDVRWSIETGGDNDGTPLVGDDGTVYFGSDDGLLRAVRPGGVLRFAVPVGGPVRAPLGLGRDGAVLVPTYGPRPGLVALDPVSGATRWRFAIEPGEGDFYGVQSGPLVDASGYIYFGGRDHFVYCLSPAGRLIWRYETGDQVDAGPALGPDGTLYVGSDDRRVYAFGREAAAPGVR